MCGVGWGRSVDKTLPYSLHHYFVPNIKKMPASQPNSVPVVPVSESASFQLELMYLQKFLEMMGETVTTIGDGNGNVELLSLFH